MTKPLTTEIAPLSSVSIGYDPGIVVYKLRLVNSNGVGHTQACCVSFDRLSGTLTVVTMEKGV